MAVNVFGLFLFCFVLFCLFVFVFVFIFVCLVFVFVFFFFGGGGNPTIEVVIFRLREWCMPGVWVVGIHRSRT